jgi:predicted nucleic acid-binding protein
LEAKTILAISSDFNEGAPKAYLDNNVVSAIAKDDTPTEAKALEELLELFEAGKVQLVTSKVTGAEIARYKGPNRRIVEVIYKLLKKVPFVEDHTVLGFNNPSGHSGAASYYYFGGASYPLVADDPISAGLRQMGLDRTDAHHLMLAIRSGCDVFLTCDPDFLSRRIQIELMYPQTRILLPSLLVAQLQ